MIRLNCLAPTLLAHHFGKKMQQRKSGGILFLASMVAYQGVPTMANYSATKAFNLLIGEALHHELKKDGIDVHVLSPGATITEFADTAGMNIAMGMKPSPVVKAGISILGGKATVIAGLRNKLMHFSMVSFPRLLRSYIVGKVMAAFKKD